MKVSITMPTMNEEKSIAKVIGDIRRAAGKDIEIIVVDSSKDRTAEIAEGLGVKVIRQEPKGPGIALRDGLVEASGDIVFSSDCDDSYPMEDIPRFMKVIKEGGYDVVSGNRMHRGNRAMPLLNRFANWVFATLVRIVYGISTKDVTTGMRAYRREVIHAIAWECNYSFPAEIVIRSVLKGFKYTELDIPYRERIGEVTLKRWRSGKAYFRCIFKYRFGIPFKGVL